MAQDPARNEFAERFAEALVDCGCDRRIVFDEEQFALLVGESEERSVLHLGNFYAEYSAIDPDGREEHVRRCALSCLTSQQPLPDEFEHARHDLRLRLWTRAMIEQIRLQQLLESGGSKLDMPLDDVGEHLYATVVYDLPTSVRSISNEELEAWDVTVYEAMEVARDNLAEDDFVFASIGERLYSAMTGDSYDSSRLLLLDMIRGLEVRGEHVAMVPNRDSLFVTGTEDDEGLEMLLDLVEPATANPRPMLFMPLRLDGDAWVDWMPAESHPLFHRFRRLRVECLLPEYERQTELLNAIHERDDVYVARYNAIRTEDDHVLSYCVWSEDVDTLLPWTDRVMFYVDGEDVVAAGSWERVLEIAGELLEETDHHPPRFRVRGFPSLDQLARIGPREL